MLILLNEIPCRSLADYMRSAKFEFVLKKNKAENGILNSNNNNNNIYIALNPRFVHGALH